MYGIRNLEKTIRFSLKSRPSERFHWPEMPQIKANVKLIFHKNVGWLGYKWISKIKHEIVGWIKKYATMFPLLYLILYIKS